MTDADGFAGVRFGPYVLHTMLGRGTYAKVYLATYRDHPEKVVALKVLKTEEESALDLPELERAMVTIRDEAQLGEWMNHLNIVSTHKYLRVGRYQCLEMEFIDGFTLEELLYSVIEVVRGRREKQRRFKGRIPPSVVIDIMFQACKGLNHAHTVTAGSTEGIGLVHRDLKPANIIVTRDGVVKLMDFGTATFIQPLREAAKTMDGTVRGSPAYMSPEQVTGKDITQKTDLFSLGTILAEILLGDAVFNATGVRDIMIMIGKEASEHSVPRVKEVAPEFAPLVKELHAKDPQERCESARSMLDGLEALKVIVSGPSLHEWLKTNKRLLPGSKPLNEWGIDGPPGEVLRLDDLSQTGMFSGRSLPKAVTREVVIIDPEEDDVEDDLDQDIRPTVQDLVVWSTSLGVQPIEPPTELEVPKVVPEKVLPVSIGGADFDAATADWTSLKPESGPKTDDWSVISKEPSDPMSSLMADTDDPDEISEEGAKKVVVLVGFVGFMAFFAVIILLFSFPDRTEETALVEPTPMPDLDLAMPEPTPDLATPTPTPQWTPVPTPRVVERAVTPNLTPEIEYEMPLVEPRRPPIRKVETPSPAPEPSGTLGTATLIVKTTPPSKVFLDGEKIGITSEKTEYVIPAGDHRLRLECLGIECPEDVPPIRLNISPDPGDVVTRTRTFESIQ